MKMQRMAATSVLFAILLTGCATTQPIPELSQPQSSGLGLQVSLRAPIGIFSANPDQIYFAKIDGEDGLLQQQIIRSNYIKDGRAYLLNARPGTYVAVAAYFSRKMLPAGTPPPSVKVKPGPVSHTYNTYFSRELVEHTKVTVRENDFVFMGSYAVYQSVGLAGADAVQIHYQNVIAPGATTGGFLIFLGADYHYRGTLLERKNDEMSRNEFLLRAKEDLAGSAWAERLK